jgi:hypothetical protein
VFKEKIAKYSWWVLRWALGLKDRQEHYIWAYLAYPDGYVKQTSETHEDAMGYKAEVIVFRHKSCPDPTLPTKPKLIDSDNVKAMREGGYL